MSVDGVNNSNNVGLYAASGAVLGAGAGATAGYLSKPFLKDGLPTDTFIKKMSENIRATMPAEQKELAVAMENIQKAKQERLSAAKSVDEFKKIYIETSCPLDMAKNFEEFKQFTLLVNEGLPEADKEAVKMAYSALNAEEFRTLLEEDFDARYSGKSLDELKNTIKHESDDYGRKLGTAQFNQYWDSSKKTFVNSEDDVGKAIKSAAKGFQRKYAMIYGAIGAAILGGIGYLCGGIGANKEAPETAQKTDIQA
ncbi:TPA: hypothetical protein CPT82_04950 [Candidatus Gastranaerophilales bacterium HUM_2]|nr:MAG TPA: hypothetical protein CPT82_04950 [Candidatus Gastranaerophilales bacterium HUM_2]